MKTLSCILLSLFLAVPHLHARDSEASWTMNKATVPLSQTSFSTTLQDQTSPSVENKVFRWSFGVEYIPFYSGDIYDAIRNNYFWEDIISTRLSTRNITMMKGQFSFRFHPKVSFTFDIAYLLQSSKDRKEVHVNYDDPGTPDYDTGKQENRHLKILDFTLGVKYYFKKLRQEKVSPYLIFGAGKQIAFAKEGLETLFLTEPPPTTWKDNLGEFLKDLNSPYHINWGFGVEYAFNTSLTLFSTMEFLYLNRKANYEYSESTDNYTTTELRKLKISELNTRFGIGLNFYF